MSQYQVLLSKRWTQMLCDRSYILAFSAIKVNECRQDVRKNSDMTGHEKKGGKKEQKLAVRWRGAA